MKQAKIGPGMAVCLVTASLFKSFSSLIDLLDEQRTYHACALVEKEILYRLLMSDQGPRLRQMATAGKLRTSDCGKRLNGLQKFIRVISHQRIYRATMA
jgi:hypothetical protein